MSAQHIVSAAAAKVSIGAAGGHRVAALLRRGDIVPEGVATEQVERLVERGLIEVVEAVEEAAFERVEIPEGDPSEEWSSKELDAFAALKGIDLAGAKTKPEKVAKIAAAAV